MNKLQKQIAAMEKRQSELTAELLHTFIEHVEAGGRSAKYSRSATQEIKIYYRGVGLIDILPESLRKKPSHEVA